MTTTHNRLTIKRKVLSHCLWKMGITLVAKVPWASLEVTKHKLLWFVYWYIELHFNCHLKSIGTANSNETRGKKTTESWAKFICKCATLHILCKNSLTISFHLSSDAAEEKGKKRRKSNDITYIDGSIFIIFVETHFVNN